MHVLESHSQPFCSFPKDPVSSLDTTQMKLSQQQFQRLHANTSDLAPMTVLGKPDSHLASGAKTLTFFKRFGFLLAFHSLGILVAIGGILLAVVMFTSLVLVPLWTGKVFLAGASERATTFLVSLVPPERECWVYQGFIALMLICIFVDCLTFYCVVCPLTIFAAAKVCEILLHLSILTLKYLASGDVRLARICRAWGPSKSRSEAERLEREDYTEQFNFEPQSDSEFFPSNLRVLHNKRITVLYFVVKVFVGVLSCAALFFTVVQPVLVLCGIQFFTNLLGFYNNLGVRVTFFTTTWIVGMVGLVVLARMSVKLTYWVVARGIPMKTKGVNYDMIESQLV